MTNIPTDQPDSSDSQPRLVAVIDIGSTSLRMQIAEILSDTSVRRIESFSQAVSLGEDSFLKRSIENDTIEDCVRVLTGYRDQLNAYGIHEKSDIRVVATSGLNEAANKLAFRDRIFIATGFEIEPFDEAELHRVTYLGVLPFLMQEPKVFSGQTLVLEVGGGTSEVLLLSGQDVSSARTFPLGSLRLRKLIESYDAPLLASRSLMEARITRVITQLNVDGAQPSPEAMLAMGGEVRFAAREISQQAVTNQLVPIKIEQLNALTESLLSLTPATIASRYHMSLPDAQSLGPALLTQTMYATQLGIREIHVADTNLRDGLVLEMAQGQQWSSAISSQMIRSAMQLGRKFKFDEAHSVHVAQLATSLFDDLQDLHQLPNKFRDTLELAAILHEIGRFISVRSRHKHASYLIQNSELFGISRSDLTLVSLVARYHRGATPQPRHVPYSRLQRDQRITVSKLAAILRVAKALDAGRRQRVSEITATTAGNRLQLKVQNVENLTVEKLELQPGSRLFENVFGKRVVLSSADFDTNH
jgi:exopolyphosphatase/guanosine-5'-triphosphate,3'-diphosphate pyrophosphatase